PPLTLAANVPPTVLPAKLMSLASKPMTGSPNTTVNRTGPAFVGSAWPAAWSIVTDGGVLLKLTVLSVLVEVALAFPAASIAAPAGMLATTVPGPVIPLTVTVYVGPVPLTVAVRVPGAVLPVKVTSPPVNPETGSLNTTVKLTGAALVG